MSSARVHSLDARRPGRSPEGSGEQTTAPPTGVQGSPRMTDDQRQWRDTVRMTHGEVILESMRRHGMSHDALATRCHLSRAEVERRLHGIKPLGPEVIASLWKSVRLDYLRWQMEELEHELVDAADPVHGTLRTVGAAGDLARKTDEANADGAFDRHELESIRDAADATEAEAACVRRWAQKRLETLKE